MDRMDMFIDVPQIKYEELADPAEADSTEEQQARTRVRLARQRQQERFEDATCNAEMALADIQKHCQIDRQSDELLKKYVDSGKLSARGYHRILKLALTIADLTASDQILFPHISEALSYRIKEEI